MISSIFLAWLQLIHNRTRFVATLGGVAFIVVLIFMQVGFQDGLYDSSVKVHESLQGNLFLTSTQYKSLTSLQSFPRTRLYQTLAFDEVASVSPVYVQFGKLKNIDTGRKSSIYVIGINPSKPTFHRTDINQNVHHLQRPDVAIYDQDSRPEFGPISKTFEQGGTTHIEVSPYTEVTLSTRLEIAGLFTMGPSFGVDGNLITSSSTFLRTFRERKVAEIDIGLVTLLPSADARQVQKSLVANLPKDINVLTLPEFISLEKHYWSERTPIGFVFRLMVAMGFIVGIGIAYQILYSNISTHLVEYATLKAIGHTNRYLLGMIFQQAVVLATLGSIPGVIISTLLYGATRHVTHLPVIMTADKILLVLSSVFAMCLISAALASQKLRSADPADIF